ncbi:MAG: N-6 DNA methylase [Phycisphaerales bacterium]|nr:N-6 DNA methylase [Phycisphaerales bacterium]
MARRNTTGPAAAETTSAAFARSVTEAYLSELHNIRSTGAGVPEIPYYPALANLFNAVGKTLKPKVRCIISIQNQGAGIPDGGLFTADQFQKQADSTPARGQLPSRGAMEVKGTREDVARIAQTEQVKKYLERYGIVIVTNLRDFLIVERGPAQQPVVARELFSLADDEEDFWRNKAAHPRATAQQCGERFIEFIKRACLHNAPLTNPKDVAWFLASYARDALARVEGHRQLPALQGVRTALEQALGMRFTEEKGEHFFRSSLVQTIFYGVFSAWVLWHRENPGPRARFDWRNAAWTLHVPFIRTIYEELAKPSRLGPLNLVEVLEWVAGVLNRVDRAEFFGRFQEEHAVQYFYEPFLEAYDPDLRKEMGVWFTPPEIVKYQVARVDTVLREELELPDGLADPNVIILDLCCGTGAYLVEVIHRIAETLRDKGGDALLASDLKKAAMERVFGFEILPAPFVVSHLQLGLMLQTQGTPLSHQEGERVGVYLTNALTGWEPPRGVKATLPLYPELQEERDAAEEVKRKKKILVILGNPPYNAFAGVSPEEEQGLVELYKKDLNTPVQAGGWGIRKFNLDDLYIRFFRLAERRIAEMTGKGVVSFISNFSYLGDPSFVVMRQRFLGEFDKLWLDCMNGDSRETGKLTPEGRPDPSVFSTEYNREGIRVGTAVCVIVRKTKREKAPTVRFRHFWGVSKRADLLTSLDARNFDKAYTRATPSRQNRYSFRPEEVAKQYQLWPLVPELGIAHFNGPVERRAGALISIDPQPLLERLRAYFNKEVSNSEVAAHYASLMMTGNRIVGPEARKKLLREHIFDSSFIVRYPFKVFDIRWAYLANIRPLFSEPSPDLLKHAMLASNHFFITRDTADKAKEGPPFYFAPIVCDYDCISGHARHFPILLKADTNGAPGENGFFDNEQPHVNLSKAARAYLAKLGIKDPDKDMKTASLIWLHALAIGYSPAYLTDNTDGIRRDWPRIPLPDSRKALEASAALGEKVAALLDTEKEVRGVTTGRISPLFRTIGNIAKVGGGAINPSSDDLAVTAGWGYAGKEGVTMPGKGRGVVRPYDGTEKRAISAAAKARRMPLRTIVELLKPETADVYLNDAVFWRNIPAEVWNFHIGGYQVIKKWLSYRERNLLGRNLKPEEAREVTGIARRIAALVLLQPDLDENYRRVKDSTYPWTAVS